MTVHIDGIIFSLQRYGGISVYTHQLLQRLAREHIPAVLTLDAKLQQTINSDLGLRVVYRDGRIAERYRYCRAIDNVQLFHSSYYRCISRSRIPSIVTVHDFVYEQYTSGPKRWIHIMQKHSAIRAAHAIICISEATRADLEKFVGTRADQKVYVIPNGVSEAFRPLSGLDKFTRPYMLYIGERRGYKNFDLLLRAMEELPDVDLFCVGGGKLSANELGNVSSSVSTRVRHLGFVSDDDLNRYYNQAMCLVYPSSYEGFGIPVIEAMRAGCPVVTIDCKAVLEVGGNALTVAESNESRALVEAINRLHDAAYRNQKVSTGFEVARKFSWHKTHEKTIAVYRECGLKVFS